MNTLLKIISYIILYFTVPKYTYKDGVIYTRSGEMVGIYDKYMYILDGDYIDLDSVSASKKKKMLTSFEKGGYHSFT